MITTNNIGLSYGKRVIFKEVNIMYLDAPMEAETICSYLCKIGFVDYVLTNDSDVLAYGCPMYLSNINNNELTLIKYNDVIS